MKNIVALALLFFLFDQTALAHAMWIETNRSGSVNEEHEINVFFGEFSHDVREDAGEESFEKVKKFELWIADQHGEKTILEAVPNGNHYTASFVPTNEGVYTCLLYTSPSPRDDR